jgi:hypothetical protein
MEDFYKLEFAIRLKLIKILRESSSPAAWKLADKIEAVQKEQ